MDADAGGHGDVERLGPVRAVIAGHPDAFGGGGPNGRAAGRESQMLFAAPLVVTPIQAQPPALTAVLRFENAHAIATACQAIADPRSGRAIAGDFARAGKNFIGIGGVYGNGANAEYGKAGIHSLPGMAPRPPVSLRQRPPDALPVNMMAGLVGSNARTKVLPPRFTGPMGVHGVAVF